MAANITGPARFDGKKFHNPEPVAVTPKGAVLKMIRESFRRHPDRSPQRQLGPFTVNREIFQKPDPGARVTWLGHSTLLLELEGKRILTDPVWYSRVSPFTRIGPKRFFEVPLSLQDVPPLDLILLSHDHYDHLDREAMLFLAGRNVPIITMLGVGKRLEKWGVKKSLITEMDWWDQAPVAGLMITACPAQHFSGRWLNDRFSTLWGAFAIRAEKHNIFYGADSGYFSGFAEIGRKLGPFDLTMLEIGAYHHLWADIHMGPENAVKAHIDLKGRYLLPIHWGTFSLAFHAWTEPVERLILAAKEQDVPLLLPAPGQAADLAQGPFQNKWWL